MTQANTTSNILKFIDFNLLFRGHISLAEVEAEFSHEPSLVGTGFYAYTDQNPESVEYEQNSKRYFQSSHFKPLYEYPAKEFIRDVKNYFSRVLASDNSAPMQSETILNFPDTLVMARLIQAILNGNPVNVIYTSLTSGSSSRDLVPHSIVDNGLRWHLRAYDRKSNEFRDFVLTRISKVTIKGDAVSDHELRVGDDQWQKIIKLEIKPHPNNIAQATAIEMDYGMLDGQLSVTTRAALAGYLLRRWNVDCSPDAKLNGSEYQLWLSNANLLLHVPSLSIAPGSVLAS